MLVLANSGAAAAFRPAGSITSSVANFNGEDAPMLEESGTVIDRFGPLGIDPGTEWSGARAGTCPAPVSSS